MSAAGSQDMKRTWSLVPSTSRRRCPCCGRRATHFGLGGGVVLVMGCEFSVRSWVRDPVEEQKRYLRAAMAERSLRQSDPER